ncbi:hypothetical protein ACET3X_006284 [Alternaria dauci]|uniref:Neutral protease 2 n=1 Tax=Alternaria dauci TaxID=48095 RepID=A0ABR3UI63_9PLEO
MKLFTNKLIAVLAFLSYTIAASVNMLQTEGPLNVQLAASGDTVVKMTITNIGDTTLNLLSTGTLLDETLPVKRITLYSNSSSKRVPFEGIAIQLDTSVLSVDNFFILESGSRKEFAIDAAALHNLSSGGSFDVFANGMLPYANENSTELVGVLRYDSNRLSISVDGKRAAAVHESPVKRSYVPRRICDTTCHEAIRIALRNCKELASGAATAAEAGDSRLITFFKSSSKRVRDQVSTRMRAVAKECNTWSSRTMSSYGGRTDEICSLGNISMYAYNWAGSSYITYCELFLTGSPAASRDCKRLDQGTTVLDEMKHAQNVFSPGTEDHTYGFDTTVQLSTDRALENADSYALFAHFVYLGCVAY